MPLKRSIKGTHLNFYKLAEHMNTHSKLITMIYLQKNPFPTISQMIENGSSLNIDIKRLTANDKGDIGPCLEDEWMCVEKICLRNTNVFQLV